MQKSYNNIGDFMLEDNINELKLRLTGLKSKTPILLLGNAAKIFINLYKKNITNINSQEDLASCSTNIINLLCDLDSSVLISYIKSHSNLVVLSINELNDDVLLSFNYVIKIPYEDTKCLLLTPSQGIDKLKTYDEDINYTTFYANECPSLYFLRKKSTNSKINQLLGDGIYEN